MMLQLRLVAVAAAGTADCRVEYPELVVSRMVVVVDDLA